MIDRKKREAFYNLIIAGETKDFSLVNFLDNSSCDEICEIDLNTGKFRQFSTSEGKYFTPLSEATFKAIYDFTYRYIVSPEDAEVYADLMNPDTMLEKLENSPLSNFRFATFRYKLQNGQYRWVEQCIVTGEKRGLKKGVIRLYVFIILHRRHEFGKNLHFFSDDCLHFWAENINTILNIVFSFTTGDGRTVKSVDNIFFFI